MIIVRLLRGFLAVVLIRVVRLYQLLISPLLGSNCRFYPSCSNYFIEAVEKYGPIVGAWKGSGESSGVIRFTPADSTPLVMRRPIES